MRTQLVMTTTGDTHVIVDLSHNPQGMPIVADTVFVTIRSGGETVQLKESRYQLKRLLRAMLTSLEVD